MSSTQDRLVTAKRNLERIQGDLRQARDDINDTATVLNDLVSRLIEYQSRASSLPQVGPLLRSRISRLEADITAKQHRINEFWSAVGKLRIARDIVEKEIERLEHLVDPERRRREYERADEARRRTAEENKRKRAEYRQQRRQRQEVRIYHEEIYRSQVIAWREATDVAFAACAAMTAFPDPPAKPCSNVSCLASTNDRALEACGCSIRAAFKMLCGTGHIADAKKERLRWHPDKFSVCDGSRKEEFQKKAKEVFVVLNEM